MNYIKVPDLFYKKIHGKRVPFPFSFQVDDGNILFKKSG